MIDGIIFDMDGLIFNSERVVQRSWIDIGKELGYPDLSEQIYHTIGFNRAHRRVYFSETYGKDFPFDLFTEKTRIRFQEIVDAEGLPIKPGVKELLSYIKEQGYAVGLATSASGEYAVEELKNARIYDYFDGFVFGNMVTNSKPDKEIYVKACEAVGVKPADALALEDAPSGVASAYAAGLRTIMVPDLVQPDEATRAKAWRVVESLCDVIPILKEE